jgi:hypothetical protein
MDRARSVGPPRARGLHTGEHELRSDLLEGIPVLLPAP